MFTSSTSSFRHARGSGAGHRGGRLACLARRGGVALIVVAFVAALPSPASADPGVIDPVGITPTLTEILDEAPTGLSVGLPVDLPSGSLVDPLADLSGDMGFDAKRKPATSRASRVMGVASAQAGDRYVYGAAGPNAFDCSGLTSFVYRVAASKNLPHSSSAQAGVTQRISRAAARPGDLVFFHNSGGIYHVGIFAGGNSIIHASQPGVPVGRAQIWTSAVSFGRVR